MGFEELRFRVFITVAMRVVLLADRIAIRRAAVEIPERTAFPPQPLTMKSQTRTLEARLVRPDGVPASSVLILHGIGDRLLYWHDAQQLLARHGIASLIVHYSGYGQSTGAITPANLRDDTIAAYASLRELVPTAVAPFVLGLSLGTGVAIDAAPYLLPLPSGIVLCEPFSSLRSAADAVRRNLGPLGSILRPLVPFVPHVYRSAANVHLLKSPLLIVHSDADELFPVAMAEEIHAAATAGGLSRADLVILHGFTHNDAYLRPSLGYWQPIVDFMHGSSVSTEPDISPASREARIGDGA